MMLLNQINLPKTIFHYINKADEILAVNEGKSGAQVYKLSYHRYGGIQNLYLKYDVKSRLYDRIIDEANVLVWLQKKVKVPEILVYDELNETEFLLTKEVNGILLSDLVLTKSVTEIIKIYAEIANEIHSTDISDCPFNQTLYNKMVKAKSRIRQNEINSTSFDIINQNYTPESLFHHLECYIPSQQILVFTHGDLYMNNIIIKNNQLSGILDWARGGYCDYHYDISVILHNIDKYMGTKYKELFFKYYKNPINENLIDYYWKLNEFF